MRGRLERLVHVDEWNIGILPGVQAADLVARPVWSIADVEWLFVPGPLEYFADPYFEMAQDGSLLVWSERYSYLMSRGEIACHRVRRGERPVATRIPTEVVHRPGSLTPHVSYPLVVSEQDGRRIGLMEMSQACRLDLFEVDPSGARWTYASTLLEGVPVLDPTLLFHEGRWWMFCSIKGTGSYDALHVFHAGDVRGPWTAHRDNPVKVDLRSSRPGGDIFTVDGRMYRPAQDCSTVYGGALTINRILALTPEVYQEEPVTRLEPAPSSAYPDGLHTLRVADGIVMIDGRRRAFHALAATVKLVANYRQAARLRRGHAMAATES